MCVPLVSVIVRACRRRGLSVRRPDPRRPDQGGDYPDPIPTRSRRDEGPSERALVAVVESSGPPERGRGFLLLEPRSAD